MYSVLKRINNLRLKKWASKPLNKYFECKTYFFGHFHSYFSSLLTIRDKYGPLISCGYFGGHCIYLLLVETNLHHESSSS